MADKQPTYSELNQQLEEVLVKMQDSDVDVDEALKLHQQGQKLVKQLSDKLNQAENEIKKLKK